MLCYVASNLDLRCLPMSHKKYASSGAESDNNHAHLDTSMKLGRNVHWHELLEFFL